MRGFSFSRWWSIVQKEFIQLRRDRPTFGMIVGIPIIQLTLFGFAVNSDPKHLPTAVVSADDSAFTRSFLKGMENTQYFRFSGELMDEKRADEAITNGEVLFIVTIPPDFTRNLLRGDHPSLLVEADATDPTATGNAVAAVSALAGTVVQEDFNSAVPALAATAATPYTVQVHNLYNPEGIAQYNIVPGLMGVILTMTLIMMTGLSITREYERGTMENLLSMPVKPLRS